MHNSSYAEYSLGWALPAPLVELASDNMELIAQLIEAFQVDTAARLQQVRDALANSDLTRLRSEAHTITCSARQVGADTLASVCHEFELAAMESPIPDLAEQVRRIEEHFDDVSMAMILYSGRPLSARGV